MAASSIVLLIFCLTLARPAALSAADEDDVSPDGNKQVDGRSALLAGGWLGGALKKAIGTLTADAQQQHAASDRQAPHQDPHPQMVRPPGAHYRRPHVMAPAHHANAKRRPSSHPPRPVMLFGGFQPMLGGIPTRPRHHSATATMMTSKPAHQQHTSQQLHHMTRMPKEQNQHQHYQYAQQQQYHNQQASPKVRNLAPRPEQQQLHSQQSQVQHVQHQHHPYPIELIQLPPPPVPPPSYAQQELLKLQFNGDEYLTYLYLNPPVIKEPEQDIQVAQSSQHRVAQAANATPQQDEHPFQPIANPSPVIYDPYRYNTVESIMNVWEKKDKSSFEDDWKPIHSPWRNQTEPIVKANHKATNTSNASA